MNKLFSLYISSILFATTLCSVIRFGQFYSLSNKDFDSSFLIRSFTPTVKSHCLLTCLRNFKCISAVIGPRIHCRLFAKDPRSLLDNNDLVLRNRNGLNLYLVSNRGFECFYNGSFHYSLDLCETTGKRVDSNCTEWSEKKPRWTEVCGGSLVSGEFKEKKCTRPFSGGSDCSGGLKLKLRSKIPNFVTGMRTKYHAQAVSTCESMGLGLFTGLQQVAEGKWNAGICFFLIMSHQIRISTNIIINPKEDLKYFLTDFALVEFSYVQFRNPSSVFLAWNSRKKIFLISRN